MTQNDNLALELARLRDAHEAARLQFEIRRYHEAAGLPLCEAWGDVVDRREARFDESIDRGRTCARAAALDDRRDGRFAPAYETELDLAQIRGEARQLGLLTGVTAGALDALANYVLAGGFTFTVASPFEQPRLVTAAQRIVDEFLDDNEFSGGLDRELHHRSREDGEAFLALVAADDGRVRARVLEPEQIAEPAQARPIENWIGLPPDVIPSWSFGVLTDDDASDVPLGYHVIFDAGGRDWDCLPPECVLHIKRNVPRNAKRGVSDFLAIRGDLEREAKLRRNTAEGAALQAAIAWILQAPPGATSAQMQSLGSGDLLSPHRRAAPSAAPSSVVRDYPPGTILKPSAGLEYKPGPMGSERNQNFILVGQHLLRSIGLRWNMPEYLISSDAGGANYASTLVAESPFVKAREADQQFYRRCFYGLIWKVLYLAWQAGRFSRLGIDWTTFEQLLDVKIDVPSVATRDPLKLVETQAAQIRLGLLSRRTAAAQAGLDYDAEVRQGARPEETGPRAPPAAGEAASASPRQTPALSKDQP